MTQLLSQYIQRSPRYVLLPQDNCLIRLAGPKQIPWEEGTEIRNVSTSGLSFTAPMDLSPIMGETIRVEFAVPGSKQMACFAKVIRLENLEPGNKSETASQLVAVEFELLNTSQRWNLKEGIGKKINNETEKVIEISKTPPMNPFLKVIFVFTVGLSLFCSAFLLFSIFKFLSQPHWMDILIGLFK